MAEVEIGALIRTYFGEKFSGGTAAQGRNEEEKSIFVHHRH